MMYEKLKLTVTCLRSFVRFIQRMFAKHEVNNMKQMRTPFRGNPELVHCENGFHRISVDRTRGARARFANQKQTDVHMRIYKKLQFESVDLDGPLKLLTNLMWETVDLDL